MGVMECDRHDCQNIMCKRTIDGTECYYICDECFEELKIYLAITFQEEAEKGEVLKAIDEFMETKPRTMSKEMGSPLSFLDELTNCKDW